MATYPVGGTGYRHGPRAPATKGACRASRHRGAWGRAPTNRPRQGSKAHRTGQRIRQRRARKASWCAATAAGQSPARSPRLRARPDSGRPRHPPTSRPQRKPTTAPRRACPSRAPPEPQSDRESSAPTQHGPTRVRPGTGPRQHRPIPHARSAPRSPHVYAGHGRTFLVSKQAQAQATPSRPQRRRGSARCRLQLTGSSSSPNPIHALRRIRKPRLGPRLLRRATVTRLSETPLCTLGQR